jgi:rubrerythrin
MDKINPCEFALDFEKEGVELYLNLARQSVNILGKELFYTLARQEVDHAQKIDEICRDLVAHKGSTLVSMEFPEIEKEIKDFFQKMKHEDLKEKENDLTGYDIAIALEKKGFTAYRDFAAVSQTPKEKEFFTRMMEEEKKHLEALRNVYFYLSSPGDWIEQDESSVWNWMNM